MIRHSSCLTSMAAALLLAALSGCAYLRKETPPPVPALALAPAETAPSFAPLYAQMSQNDPSLPELPAPPSPSAQPTPPPASVIVDATKKPARNGRHHGRKGEVEVADRESHENRKESPPDTTPVPTEGQNVKVTAPTPSGDTSTATPIGQLTAGPSQDTTGSRQEASSLIDTTRRGVDSLHNLSGDQVKTVARIRSFLDQAQRALQKDDVDGAHTLATKAKTLLDELTGAA